MKIIVEVDGDELAEFASIPRKLDNLLWKLDVLLHSADKQIDKLDTLGASLDRQSQDVRDTLHPR